MDSFEEINGYYKTLEVSRSTSLEEIAESYRVLVKVWHPDRFAHDPVLQARAQEKLKELNEAYEQLKRLHNTPATRPSPASSTPVYSYPYTGGDEAARHGLLNPRLFAAVIIILGLAFSAYVFTTLMGSGTGFSGGGKMVIETAPQSGASMAEERPKSWGGERPKSGGVVRSASGVVMDRKRGLAWMRDGNHWEKTVGFSEADGLIKGLSASGYAGCRAWRLPTYGELLALSQEPDGFKARFRNLRGAYLSSTPAMLDDYVLAINVWDGRKEDAWKRGASGFLLLPVCELPAR